MRSATPGAPDAVTAPSSARDQPRQLLGLLLERRHEIRLLAGEAVVQQRLRDPGRARDRGHRELRCFS